jgi:hypothetical protein
MYKELKTKKAGLRIRTADVILTAALFVGAVTGAFFAANAGVYADDARVTVTVNGELYGVYPVNMAREIVVKKDYENVIVIEKDGAGRMRVRMTEADCPGQDCVHHAPIDRTGQRIVCLPNRLSVEIKGGEGEVDAYTY